MRRAPVGPARVRRRSSSSGNRWRRRVERPCPGRWRRGGCRRRYRDRHRGLRSAIFLRVHRRRARPRWRRRYPRGGCPLTARFHRPRVRIPITLPIPSRRETFGDGFARRRRWSGHIGSPICPRKAPCIFHVGPPARPCQYIQALRISFSNTQLSIFPPLLWRTSRINPLRLKIG